MSGFIRFRNLGEDLYTLLSVLNAEKLNLALLQDPDVYDCLDYNLWVVGEAMVEQLIINCAVRLRMVEDRFRLKNVPIKYPYKQQEVCRFVVGTATGGDTQKSGLRLAGDKIVHANKVSYYDDDRYDVIYIEGDRAQQTWRVEIDVIKFAIAGMCLTTQYENNWDVSTIRSEPIRMVIQGERLVPEVPGMKLDTPTRVWPGRSPNVNS
ncbi:MAG: hypothetical protein QOJ59_1708 [Thermomicrobiales bacterium]|jgi:hypothetical protein|nr:hypothetical protein [Thermomicrobiales bacterium]